MKSVLVLAAAVVLAMPVVSVPTVSDAQVLTGRGRGTPTRRARPAPPPRLSEAEENRLWDAQAELETLDEQIAEVQAAAQAEGGVTAEQHALLNTQATRRAELQAVITALEGKRDHR